MEEKDIIKKRDGRALLRTYESADMCPTRVGEDEQVHDEDE